MYLPPSFRFAHLKMIRHMVWPPFCFFEKEAKFFKILLLRNFLSDSFGILCVACTYHLVSDLLIWKWSVTWFGRHFVFFEKEAKLFKNLLLRNFLSDSFDIMCAAWTYHLLSDLLIWKRSVTWFDRHFVFSKKRLNTSKIFSSETSCRIPLISCVQHIPTT